jgi:hypothetical protein
MASTSAVPSDPATDLAAAEAARERLTGSLRLPSWFHTSLGVAITVQIGSAAFGVSEGGGGRVWAVVPGFVVLLVVSAVLLVRFRRLNRVRVDGLFSRAVMGTSYRSTLAYSAAFAGALWAALAGQWWLVGVAAVAGGAGYAVSAWLWWRDYLRDPAGHARGESRATLVLIGCAALAALVLLVLAR